MQNNIIANVMNIGLAVPKTLSIAFCTYGILKTVMFLTTPVDKHINTVTVHKINVSIYANNVCTNHCLRGCETLTDVEVLNYLLKMNF